MNINPKITLPIWPTFDQQSVEINGFNYRVTDIVELTKGLEPFNLKVKGLYINYNSPSEDSLSWFCTHMIAVLKADMEYPIVLSPNGVIMDGRHRLCKAIIEGHSTIKAVQLTEWPEGEKVED